MLNNFYYFLDYGAMKMPVLMEETGAVEVMSFSRLPLMSTISSTLLRVFESKFL